MESIMAYGGNNLMNFVVLKIYTSKRNLFKGSGRAGGMQYTFDVSQTPIAKLVTGKSNYNIEISIPAIHITVKGGIINFDKTLGMLASGKLALVAGKLSLTNLMVSPVSNSIADKLVVDIINLQIAPKLQAAINQIPIPQLNNLFGSSLSISIKSGSIINGPALALGCKLNGKTGIAVADSLPGTEISSLNNQTATNANVIGMVSGSAVNAIIKSTLKPISDTFDKRAKKLGFGAGVRGTIKASTPVFSIKNGVGNIATTISITGFKAGIDAPLISWKWVSIKVPQVSLVIKHSLSASGNKGLITLTGVDKIKVNLKWPKVLKPVENLVEKVLNGVLSLFEGLISKAVKGKKFELFALPKTVPGTTIAAKLSFPTGGLAYFKSSVKAKINIKA